MIRAYLLDDEPLALERLARMLDLTGRVNVAGQHTDPVDALNQIRSLRPALLFLDIHMPGLTGFEVLAELPDPPLVIFTTAYDQYALEAFHANSLDYLLKPVEPSLLERAIAKAERMLGQPIDPQFLITQLQSALQPLRSQWLTRIASRSGDKVELVDLNQVTHFYARDKLTYAVTSERDFVVDQSITDLAERLNPDHFVRIHRSAIVNIDYLHELHAMFGGHMTARLKDKKRTELPVARERVRALKAHLGLEHRNKEVR